jgi:uncharacterized coiled-coil protein SlyX
MIHSLKTLRKLDDLRLSSLASHLADQAQEIEELKNDRIEDRKRIKELQILVERLEELVEGA